MRLLNTTTLKLESEFAQLPFYAILSHRWEDEEVTFQDLESGKGSEKWRGYRKLLKCCKQASLDGLSYVWIDTCCIDKTSSAELLEAINSMFKWYRDAEVCYAYLHDVNLTASDLNKTKLFESDIRHMEETGVRTRLEKEVSIDLHSFHMSEWFKRGWTLQELLAPRNVVFFNCSWNDIGTKSTLDPIIRHITGITDLTNWETASVAQKNVMAAYRATKVVEDRGYCMMRLSGINMPLLYGEGENAFIRLQLEILQSSDDESLFAWENSTDSNTTSGLLAPSPYSFRNSGDIVPRNIIPRPPYSMTNRGLRMDIIGAIDRKTGHFITPLNCVNKGCGPVSLYLTGDSGRVQRVRIQELVQFSFRRWGSKMPDFATVYIKQTKLRPEAVTDEVIWNPNTMRLWARGWDRALIQTKDLEYCGFVSHKDQVWSNYMPTWDKWEGLIAGKIDFRFRRNGSYGLEFSNGNLKNHSALALDREPTRGEALIPLEQQPLEELATKLDLQECPDRVSQLLPSGQSVSAIIKKGLDLDTPTYFVDINIHDDGRLEWPRERIDYRFRVLDKPLRSEISPKELPSELPTAGPIGIPGGLADYFENEFERACMIGYSQEVESETNGHEEEKEEEDEYAYFLRVMGLRDDGSSRAPVPDRP